MVSDLVSGKYFCLYSLIAPDFDTSFHIITGKGEKTMAKVYQQKDGRFVYKTTETYKGRNFTVKGSSRKGKTEAKKAWQYNKDRKIAEIDSRIAIRNGDIRVDKALPHWYETFKKHDGRTARTIGTDMDTINQLVLSPLGSMKVNEITAEDLQNYLNKIFARGLSNSTIKKRRNMLSMFLDYFYPSDNPMKVVKVPKKARTVRDMEEKTALSDEEMTVLSEELAKPYKPGNGHKKNKDARGYLNGGILTVILWEFLRLSEATELRVKDVDLDAGVIHVMRQYDEKDKIVGPPKYNSIRDIPISGHCRTIIENAMSGKLPEDLLFRAGTLNARQLKHGGHILEKCIDETLTKACDHAGIIRQVPHDLRHDGISYLVRHGAHATSVQKWAGHKSLAVTLDIYYRKTGIDDPADIAIMADNGNTAKISGDNSGQ